MSRLNIGLVALAAVFCLANLSLAQTPKPSPIYRGPGLPTPPQQHAAWRRPATKLPAFLLKDVELLFDQGMADPRGCEYRQIEVVTGNCWSGDSGICKTHGWVLPEVAREKQRFAVCWNGLVYPAVSAGGKSDLTADIKAIIARGDKPTWRQATPEVAAVSFETAFPIKTLMLLRLGNTDLAESYWPVVKNRSEYDPNGQQQPRDAYLSFAREWCWYAFDRAVCAHMWGNDVVSRDTARALSSAKPQIEATAKNLGKRPLTANDDPNAPYISFPGQLPELLADEERRVKDGTIARVLEDPKKFPDKRKRIAALIRDLELVSARQWGQPGGVGLDDDPVPQALGKEGTDAVEPLLDCLEKDDRLTRSVSFGRSFFENRHLLSVRGAAYAVLQRILQTETFGPASDDINRGGEGHAKAIAAEIRKFWANSKGKTIAQRWFDTLADDDAGPARWVEAAGHIVEPADVERRGQWIVTPLRRPGGVPAMNGEALRAKKNPSVSELMATRVPSVAGEQGGWLFAQDNAARLTMDLHKWDAAAAAPSLYEQMQRCMDRSDGDPRDPEDPKWAQSTQTTALMARDIGQLITALAESHDVNGTKLYRKWVVKQKPATPGFNVGEMLRPIWLFPDEPNLAATAEELFNGPKSTWRCLPTAMQFSDHELMASPIYGVPAFRKHLARNLNDLTDLKDSLAGEFADAKLPVRVCDWYACHVAKLDGAPPYEMSWPLAKRDGQRKKLLAFLERWGNRFRYTPLQSTLDFGFDDRDSGRMTFPKLDRPATDADVAATTAVFALHGGPVRVVALPTWPAKAKWTGPKDHPALIPGKTDLKTGAAKHTEEDRREGFVWQAEEVQVNGKWERYYGFVGPHAIEKVPAKEIEFIKTP
jgi:hypothetical protein